MAKKMKNLEKTMKNSLGLAGYGDISYKDWGISVSINLLPGFEIFEFDEHDEHEDSIRHLGIILQYIEGEPKVRRRKKM